jgi:hypothetical protein
MSTISRIPRTAEVYTKQQTNDAIRKTGVEIHSELEKSVAKLRDKLDLNVYGYGNASVTFPDGFSVVYGGEYTAPSGGERFTFVGPVPSSNSFLSGYKFYYPSHLGTLESFNPNNYSVWCLVCDDGGTIPGYMMYRTGPTYDISNWESAAPTLTLNKGEASGGEPTMARNISAIDDTLAKVSQMNAALDGKAPINSPAFTGTPTVPDPTYESPITQVANISYVNRAVDDNSPLVARSFAVPVSGTMGDGSASTIYFRPRFFGMSNGDRLKGFLVKRYTNVAAADVYAKLFLGSTELAQSRVLTLPATADTYATVEFPTSVSLANKDSQYRLVFYGTDNVEYSATRLTFYISSASPDCYYGASQTFIPEITVQFYSWASDLVPNTRTINDKPLSTDVTLTGADIEVSTQDTMTINDALSGKLDKSGGTVSGWVDFGTEYNAGLRFGNVVFRCSERNVIELYNGMASYVLHLRDGEWLNAASLQDIAPEFSPSTSYASNDLCAVSYVTNEYVGRLYRCVNPNGHTGVWVDADFTPATVEDVLAALRTGKLDSTSAAPAFSTSATYSVGEHVTHEGRLYECTEAVTASGDWDPSKWTDDDMTSPDATLDVTLNGQLRLVSANGEQLWAQGYDLATESSSSLRCDRVNLFAFEATTASAFSDSATYSVGERVAYSGKVYACTTAVTTAGAWTGSVNWDEDPDTQSFEMPTTADGKRGDFIVDIDNTANAVETAARLEGLDSEFSVVVRKGESVFDLLTFAPGELSELYFTQTAFRVNDLPTWKLVKNVVEDGGAE